MEKILYVEDNPAQRNAMAQMLKLKGFEVEVSEDGLRGVEKAISWLPDLILIDLKMPRMNGVEAIKQIRETKATAAIPIVVLASVVSDEDQKRLLEAGANAFLDKPLDLGRLVPTIKGYLAENQVIL